jgi:hypothetical protein
MLVAPAWDVVAASPSVVTVRAHAEEHTAARTPGGSVLDGALGTLREYWFGDGFRLSLAVVRIAVALAILRGGLLQLDFGSFLATASPDAYHPKGVLMLFGNQQPAVALFTTAATVSRITAWLMLIGLLTRAAIGVNLLCNLLLSAILVSFEVHWGHKYSIFVITELALLFAPAGDVLSVDALLRHALGRPPPRRPHGAYRWPVLLAQFSVALPFANGAWWKLIADHFHLGWIFSDNLRHWLVYQYYLMGREPTPLVAWIMARSWRYMGAALGNIVSQTMPLVACLLVGYPVLRAVGGAFFLLELLSLCFVMSLCSFGSWAWLYPVFVDWDRLVAWIRARVRSRPGSVSAIPTVPATRSPRYMLVASTYIALFLGFWIFVGVRGRDDVAWTYPFTAYPLYDGINVREPYSRHQIWEQRGTLFDIDAESPVPDAARAWLALNYPTLGWYSLDDVRGQGRNAWKYLEDHFGIRLKRLGIKKTIFVIPAYPASPRPVPGVSELRGILTADHFIGVSTRRGYDGATKEPVVGVLSQGLVAPHFRLNCATLKGIRPLPGTWKHDVYYFVEQPDRCFVAVDVEDESLPGGRARFLGEPLD